MWFCRKLNSLTSYAPTPPVTNEGQRKNILLIHCHPVLDSFSSSLALAASTSLKNSGCSVRFRRLYLNENEPESSYCEKTFPPTLTADERLNYYNSLSKSTEVNRAIEDLKWCDGIVFVYPTWWFNFPAVLKGFIDRVFIPGVAFHLPNSTEDDSTGTGLVPGLTNIKKIGVITTYGASFSTVLYAGDNSRRFLSKGFRPLCASGVQLEWHGLYDMDNKSKEERNAFLKEIEEAYKFF